MRFRMEIDFVAVDKRQAKRVFDELAANVMDTADSVNVVAARLRAPKGGSAPAGMFDQLTGGN